MPSLANIAASFASEDAVNEVYNIAYGDRISLNALWKALQETSGITIEAVHGPSRVGDVRHSLANIDKTRKLLDYNPLFSVKSGLEVTWEHFQK